MIDMLAERSPDEKAAALAVYAESGLAEAHRQTGIPKATLHAWARKAGMDPSAIAAESAERTIAATDARIARCAAMRLELREQLLVTAQTMLDRIDLPHTEFRGNLATEVEYPVAPADACKAYVTSAAICIDKFRLEVGEATELHGVAGDPGEVESMRDELSKRRLARAS